jgi:Cu/Ag efflux pump CusA
MQVLHRTKAWPSRTGPFLIRRAGIRPDPWPLFIPGVPDPGLSKADLIKRLEGELNTFPGNAYEITQPIQMRFNELIAGVRGDMAIKVFGDDFNAMNLTADKIASILRRAGPPT